MSFLGWENTDYLWVFGLVLNTNRTNLGPPRSSAPPLSPASPGRERREQQRGQNTCLGG